MYASARGAYRGKDRAVAIAAGTSSFAALRDDGVVMTWGAVWVTESTRSLRAIYAGIQQAGTSC